MDLLIQEIEKELVVLKVEALLVHQGEHQQKYQTTLELSQVVQELII